MKTFLKAFNFEKVLSACEARGVVLNTLHQNGKHLANVDKMTKAKAVEYIKNNFVDSEVYTPVCYELVKKIVERNEKKELEKKQVESALKNSIQVGDIVVNDTWISWYHRSPEFYRVKVVKDKYVSAVLLVKKEFLVSSNCGYEKYSYEPSNEVQDEKVVKLYFETSKNKVDKYDPNKEYTHEHDSGK